MAAIMLLACLGVARGQTAQVPSGLSLSIQFGPIWTSNPRERPGKRKGDLYWEPQARLSYRLALWHGANVTIGVVANSEWFSREIREGLNRLAGTVILSQTWQGTTLTLGVAARTETDQALRKHDDASQDLVVGLSRNFTLQPGWTLTANLGAARRLYQNGSNNEFRSRGGLVLARKWEPWTWRLGMTAGYLLEDNTTDLPRIRDRTVTTFVSATYEWAKDRDLGLRVAYSRTFSSYRRNRSVVVSVAPQVSAVFRF